jgi:hypothetical protein
MTPCSRLYGFLGTRLAPLTRADSPYIEWVRTYADAEYQALPQRMEALLDELGGAEDFGEVPCLGHFCSYLFFFSPLLAPREYVFRASIAGTRAI